MNASEHNSLVNPQDANPSLIKNRELLDMDEAWNGRQDDFGNTLANHYFMMPRSPESEQARLKEGLHDRAAAVRETLQGYIADEAQYSRIARAVDNYPIPEQLRDKIYANSPAESDLINALTTSDDTTLAEFCIWNRDYQEELQKEKAPLIEAYRKDWIERVQYAIQHQNLPVSMEQLEARMQQVRITLGDTLTLHGIDAGGYYEAATRKVVVGSSYRDDDLKEILWHELMHHLSGQTIAQVTTNLPGFEDLAQTDEFDNEPHVSYDVRRVGLRVNNASEPRRWLNEAVTEQLTQVLLSEQGRGVDFQTIPVSQFFYMAEGSGSYQAERDRAGLFLDGQTLEETAAKTNEEVDAFPGKIPTNALLPAYFEDHNPKKPKGAKAEARRALWSAIIKAYPDHYTEEVSAKSVDANISLPPEYFDVSLGIIFDKFE